MNNDITWDVDPAREAKVRCNARVEISVNAWNHLSVMRTVIEEFTRMGVPDDAYINFSYPTAWASWERPYTTANMDEIRALRLGAHDHTGVTRG